MPGKLMRYREAKPDRRAAREIAELRRGEAVANPTVRAGSGPGLVRDRHQARKLLITVVVLAMAVLGRTPVDHPVQYVPPSAVQVHTSEKY